MIFTHIILTCFYSASDDKHNSSGESKGEDQSKGEDVDNAHLALSDTHMADNLDSHKEESTLNVTLQHLHGPVIKVRVSDPANIIENERDLDFAHFSTVLADEMHNVSPMF